jgi:hypothetical protein
VGTRDDSNQFDETGKESIKQSGSKTRDAPDEIHFPIVYSSNLNYCCHILSFVLLKNI